MVGAIVPRFEVAEGAMDMQGMGGGFVQFVVIIRQSRLLITLPAIGIDHASGLDVAGEKITDGHRIGALGQCQPVSGGRKVRRVALEK